MSDSRYFEVESMGFLIDLIWSVDQKSVKVYPDEI